MDDIIWQYNRSPSLFHVNKKMVARPQKTTSDNTRYYEMLGVSKTASQYELRSGFIKQVMKDRPIPGKDNPRFDELFMVHAVLSDPAKRNIYDQYGEDALKERMGGGRGHHHPFHVFQSTFYEGNAFGVNWAGSGSSQGQRQRMGEDVILPLQVSLEELYNGTLKKLSFSRNVICSKCKGKGSKSSAPMACAGCQGSGMKASICHLGHPMIQKIHRLCKECRGTGVAISDRDWCLHCKGEKTVQEKKVFEIVVEKGMLNGQKITFPGEVDEPDTVTGDIVFVLQQKEHAKFKRNGDDLFVGHTVSLTEALCGFQFVLTHLDNRQLLIKSNPGEVLMPDQFMAINGGGMPMYQRPFMRGKLYIHFTVDFPRSLTLDQCKALETVLPPRTSVQLQDQLKDMVLGECEETTLYRVNVEEIRMKQARQSREAYDEEGYAWWCPEGRACPALRELINHS
ncbi:dnaJ protein [Cinnamomum micranthum f. kanehirae]|uniref:DnaJ protein n=1 Tax=Cinnamomum micranthum f. kanehirae TaxID=337451 RepID=A0A3S3MYY3_9MAGN|nr:dnaJ protein [Cinnamomum micranthum f. kanehirae]